MLWAAQTVLPDQWAVRFRASFVGTQMAPGCVQSVTPGGRALGWNAFGGCVYVETVTHPCRAKTLAPKGSAHLQRVTTEPVCELAGLDADTKYIPDPNRPSRRQRVGGRAAFRIVADDDEPCGRVSPHVHVGRRECIDARVVEDRLPEGIATEEEITRKIDLAVGADDGAGKVEQRREGRDGERVDEPVAGRIPRFGHGNADTRREE